jgi:recombinational DNA repair ATPase RecF
MADDQLKNLVLQRAEDDEALSDDAKLVVMAALESDDDLADVLASGETAVERVAQLNARIDESTMPVGAYLRSISVQGFRGIGARVKVDIPPGPGLIVIAGRNGSGKSSIAEALELALTGVNSRWTGKAAVWTKSWRNLHADVPAEVRIGITEEGSGVTTLGVDWPAGDVPVAEHTTWVQREGKKQEPPSVLGWSAALDLYRPLLSYDELGTILEGRPVDFYDQLFKLLGLEQLTSAIARLDAEVGRFKQPVAAFSKAKAAAKLVLTGIDDPRAAPALQEVGRHWPPIDAVRAYVSGADADAVPRAWRLAEMLGSYTADGLTDRLVELRAAAAAESAERERADALVADRVELLERALDFHHRHGNTACPVCSSGTLDEAWVTTSREVIEAGRASTAALAGARGRLAAARAAVRRIVTDVPPVVHHDALTAAAAAGEAERAWKAVPADGDLALADHVERNFPQLQRAYQQVADEAARLIRDRSDAWAPAVEVLVEWLRAAEAFIATDAARDIALIAHKWLKDNANQLRNERLAPLADRSREIWAALRQESNVELSAIQLDGQGNHRKVLLEASVDGAATEAFGVMSQGELHALALAIFLPRATVADSPFRFIVLDDPIQAMDPSKIEGFLDVMTQIAKERQVIILTHDNRLPEAIRRSSTNARIVEVTRSRNSTVSVVESARPALRMLADAVAIAKDTAVPLEIRGRAVPALCREAVESTAWEVFSARALAQGRPLFRVEEQWEEATTTKQRIALALHLDPKAEIGGWTNGNQARSRMMKIVTAHVHEGTTDPIGDYEDTKVAVSELRKVAP